MVLIRILKWGLHICCKWGIPFTHLEKHEKCKFMNQKKLKLSIFFLTGFPHSTVNTLAFLNVLILTLQLLK